MNRSANALRGIAWLYFLSMLILAGCQAPIPTQTAQKSQSMQGTSAPVTVDGGTYENITPKMLASLLSEKNFVLINVHIPRSGDIPHTDLAIPYDQIEQNLGKLPADKNAKIVLYCSSGHMSSIAAKKLVELGYTNVWNLSGGMSAWQQEGFQIEVKQ
jgi:rhodanese-related sulfurtransferase